jgi:hypothetical protein
MPRLKPGFGRARELGVQAGAKKLWNLKLKLKTELCRYREDLHTLEHASAEAREFTNYDCIICL